MTRHPGGTSAACAVLLAILLFPLQTIAQGVNCGSPPPVANENLRAEIAGQAQLLSKYFGDVSLAGQIEKSRTEIFSKYPDAEKSRSNAFYQYQVCVILMNDSTIPWPRKLEELNKIQREFSRPLQRSSEVTTGKNRAEFLEEVRSVLRAGLPVSEIESAMRAISKLRAMISEDQSDDSLQQAVQILVSYIKSNIQNRKVEVENLISLDPRGVGTFQPKDIIFSIETLAKIRDASNGRIKIHLLGTDFSRIDFSSTDFASPGALDMAGFYFNFSNFEHALLGCRCHGATFEHAKLRNVAVWNADFSAVNFGQADIAGSKWANVDFTGSNIEKALNYAHVVLMTEPRGLTGYQQGLFSIPCLQTGCGR